MAARKAFQEMVAKDTCKNINAFALYSEEDAMAVCPATNTLDFLAAQPQHDKKVNYKKKKIVWKIPGIFRKPV